jgi:hypothetical protein
LRQPASALRRSARRSLPLHQWAHLDRTAEASRWDSRGQLDRGVEVIGLKEEVAAKRLLRLDEWAVGGQRLGVGVVPCWINNMYFIAFLLFGNGCVSDERRTADSTPIAFGDVYG